MATARREGSVWGVLGIGGRSKSPHQGGAGIWWLVSTCVVTSVWAVAPYSPQILSSVPLQGELPSIDIKQQSRTKGISRNGLLMINK